jgi:hypothetical protein
MSDLENLVPLEQARDFFPGSPHLSTLRRWYTNGVRGRKLPIRWIGGRIYVHRDEAAQFIGAAPQPRAQRAKS